MERKDDLIGINGSKQSWPCFGKPAIVFYDQGKIFTSERAYQIRVDRPDIITKQAPLYAPSKILSKSEQKKRMVPYEARFVLVGFGD